MKRNSKIIEHQTGPGIIFIPALIVWLIVNASCSIAQSRFQYLLSTPNAASNYCHVELKTQGWNQDTLQLKMPKWMPGYYQLMNYARNVENMEALDSKRKSIAIEKVNDNTWSIAGIKNKSFTISYDIKANRNFVASSYVDTTHTYLAPCGVFLYANGFLNSPVSVEIILSKPGAKIVTGLQSEKSQANKFFAPDFDILYDCPILIGNLEELPSFKVKGVEHRFIGYAMGSFDRAQFMSNLKKMVEAAVSIVGDIPFTQYTFIAIGPGRGGIEHLNNTTVSFDGKGLDTPAGKNKVMNFLAHEYFHHYNVKRIRPLELGPFDYDQGTRTNLLWVSEGLSVYYEYLVVRRAGLVDDKTLLSNFDNEITTLENNPGRLHQSLTQASYATWSEGPFGTQGSDPKKSISYYNKGPVVGLLLDLAIRNSTQNKKSLDDVMMHLYWEYYKKLNRGFTDAEFQQTCERVAGIPLANLFEFVYATKEIDYSTYLDYAGLKLEKELPEGDNKKIKFSLKRIDNPTSQQKAIFESWLGIAN